MKREVRMNGRIFKRSIKVTENDIQTGDLDMRTTAITIFNDATTDLPAKDAVKEEESSVCSYCVNSLKKNSVIGEHQDQKRQGLMIENSQN